MKFTPKLGQAGQIVHMQVICQCTHKSPQSLPAPPAPLASTRTLLATARAWTVRTARIPMPQGQTPQQHANLTVLIPYYRFYFPTHRTAWPAPLEPTRPGSALGPACRAPRTTTARSRRLCPVSAQKTAPRCPRAALPRLACAPTDLFSSRATTRISARSVMLTITMQEILRRLSGSASRASPAQAAPPDLEAHGNASASQASSWSPMPLTTHARPAVPAPTPPPPTPQSATIAPPAPSPRARESPVALRAPAAASRSPRACPRASPVLRPPGRTWTFPDT
jgi:hypothetical protein